MVSQRAVSIRLTPEGGDEIKRLFEDVANSGDASAQRLVRSYQRASDDVEAAAQRQANALAKVSAIMPKTAMQMQIDAAAGSNTRFGGGYAASGGARLTEMEGAAKRSTIAFRELIAEQERLEERARRLVASIDPAAAAQDRYNAEMAEAQTLISKGVITLDQYVAKLGQERAALAQATDAHGGVAASSNAMRSAMTGASFQVQDLITQISMGANPINAFTVQGMQLAGGFAYVEGRLGAVARFLIGPWGLAISGGLLVLGWFTKGLLDNGDAAEKAADGLRDFQQRQSDIGNFIDLTTGKIKEQNRQLVLNAVLTREGQIASNRATITESRNAAFDAARRALATGPAEGAAYAEDRGGGLAMGGVDADVARVVRAANGDVAKLTEGLANLARTSRPDLRNVALEVSGIAGQAVIAQRENEELRRELQALNGDTRALAQADASLIDARAKLAGATTAADRAQAQFALRRREIDARWEASDKGVEAQTRRLSDMTAAERDLNVAQDAARRSGDARAVSLGRQADAMEENARGALDLARAYLEGGSAAIRAEAARRGATDAARRGIGEEAQIRRQLAIMVGDELAQGAQSVAQLREETEARASVRAQVLAGTMSINEMDDALAEEAALRPLLKLQLVAQGEALELLNRLIGNYRQAMAAARAEESQTAGNRWIASSIEQMNELQAQIADLDFSPIDQAVNAASRAANLQADSLKLGKDDPKRLEMQQQAVATATADSDLNRERSIRQVLQGQRESLALASRELDLLGASDNVREAELAKLRLIIDLDRMGVSLESEKGRKALENQDVLNAIVNRLERQKEAWAEIRNIGGAFVDEVLSPDTWDDWGKGGKRIMDMLRTEMIRLALLNPIRNMLFGEQNATIGSVLGRLAGAGPTTSPPKVIPGKAAGTDYFSGGAMLVGELGPEILHAPRGARVTTAADTRRMLAPANASAPTIRPYFDMRGAVVTSELMEDVDRKMALAAAQGAAGGAQLSEVSMSTRGRRKLGRSWG